MKTSILGIATGAAMALSASGATAATLNIADGGVGCESGYSTIGGISCGGNTIGDIGQGFSGDAINFAGSGTLLGFVADASGTSSNYADGAMMTFDTAVEMTFSIFGFDNGFDGTLSIGPSLTSLTSFVFDASNTSAVIGTFAAGTYFFKFDATTPDNSENRTDSFYSVEVAAVPLPASALLLLAGAGALAGLRRKKS